MLILLELGAMACTGIPAPPAPIGDADAAGGAPIEIGEPVPSVRLLTSGSTLEIDPAEIRGRTLVLTFVAALEGDPSLAAEILDRLATVDSRLAVDQRDRVLFILVPLERSEAAWVMVRRALTRRNLSDARRWLVVIDQRERVLNLAARFSVVTWEEPGQGLVHTVSVAVLRDGIVRDLLHGLDSWGIDDLLASVTAASAPPRP